MSEALDRYKQKQAEIKAKDLAAKQAGTMIGRIIEHPYADGYAMYEIVGQKGKNFEIAWVDDGGDAWVLPAWGKKTTISGTSARSFVERKDAMARLFGAADDWWEAQQVGSILHYHNGFGQWIRGKVVEREGKKQLKPEAMVGKWDQRDLWSRRDDGTIAYGYHVEGILSDKVWQPHVSNMYEGECKTAGNPTILPPIDLTIPELNPAEQELAGLVQLSNQVQSLLQAAVRTPKAGRANTVRQALLLARKMLKNVNG
jgi:hypothetical protein